MNQHICAYKYEITNSYYQLLTMEFVKMMFFSVLKKNSYAKDKLGYSVRKLHSSAKLNAKSMAQFGTL